jgi:hypothetical protein
MVASDSWIIQGVALLCTVIGVVRGDGGKWIHMISMSL